MTAPARITQADMVRATKAVASAHIERARIIMDLAKGRIEIIIGDPAIRQDTSDWSDDDV